MKTVRAFRIPVLAVVNALALGALTIWLTSGSLDTVAKAFQGLIDGSLLSERGLSETFVATIPYVFASLAVALAFQAGLFNIGVEGQFTIGALSAVFVGTLSHDWPALIHLPLTLLGAMAGAGAWAGIAGVLKARFGAHEVINTIMMNYIAFRIGEYLITDKSRMRDPASSAVQTSSISQQAELWRLWDVPNRLHDPLNALLLGIVLAGVGFVIARWLVRGFGPRTLPRARLEVVSRLVTFAKRDARSARWMVIGGALAGFVVGAVVMPLTISAWWPFVNDKDRLHIGVFIAPAAAVLIWWLIYKTTIGFELRTVGRNSNAAIYAGINRGRNIVLAMVLSGALAGLAGATEVMGVSTCRCLPLFFSSGYGFDSIAIALVAATHPLGILPVALLFGALRNGADLMELRSGVSKYIISLIQAFVLLFVAAPIITRAIYRIKAPRGQDEGVPMTRGWGS
jgi:general nucleoside transport system permease protein